MFDDNYIRRRAYVSRRQKQRRRHRIVRTILVILLLLIVVLAVLAGIFFFKMKKSGQTPDELTKLFSVIMNTEADNDNPGDSDSVSAADESQSVSPIDAVLKEAEALALTYDYDGAISLLSSSEYAEEPAVAEAIASYREIKTTLVRVNPSEVTHIFFHSLIMDNAKAFDGDSDEKGYNQVMTTKYEFLNIMEQMYDRGYVLVKMHDIAYETVDDAGNVSFVTGNIMLPKGKKAVVLSQDDVCYYDYMKGDGFASRMVIGEDGKPACEMIMDDGSVSVGSYDLVPLLEDFIAEHPDFSYKGARGVLAFTGYQGILGYRTDPEYKDSNPNYEEDCESARQVALCLRDNGWELASHSWGHIDLSQRDLESVKIDADKWESRVESLIGETDIILYPFGSDVGDWRPYSWDNEKFVYLFNKGFRYFCNVDSNQHWVQINDKFMRQGRRNLDGYRMYYDLPETNPEKTYLDDLFDVTTVFDLERPTPVPPM